MSPFSQILRYSLYVVGTVSLCRVMIFNILEDINLLETLKNYHFVPEKMYIICMYADFSIILDIPRRLLMIQV